MCKNNEAQEGLKTKRLLDKVQNKLNNIQAEGSERILLIAETLREELTNQGYEMKEDCSLISIWTFKGTDMHVDAGGKTIKKERDNNE